MSFHILEPDEELSLARLSEGQRNKRRLSVLKGSDWVPIVFDSIDYIDCNKVVCHMAALTADESDDGFMQDKCRYFTEALSDFAPEESVTASLLEPDEKPEVFYHSSINQHKNKLSVLRGGEIVPISFDAIDYIDCNHVETHVATLTDGDDIGFSFPVDEQVLYSDVYATYDTQGVRQEKLRTWFGEGVYDKYFEERSFLNADNGSLGVKNKETLRIGLNYALANKTLEPDEE